MPRLKYAGLALLALFSFSILASIPNAWSLSPITFTTTDTATSINQQFQRVWENSTNSVIMLDTNNAGEYFKEEYSVAGQTVSSLDTTVTSGGDTTDSDANISPVDSSRSALLFNGSDEYAQAAANTVFNITTEDFTLWGYIYRTTDTGAGETIIRKSNGAGAGYIINIESNDKMNAYLSDGGTIVNAVSSSSIAVNTWYFWAASYDRSGNLVLYLHNVSTDTTESAQVSIAAIGSATNTETFTIARNSASAGSFFPGRMDEMGVLVGTAISSGQFNQLVDDPLAVTPTSFFDFNDGVGTAAWDLIGSDNLILQNTPTWTTSVPPASTTLTSSFSIGRDAGTGNLVYGKFNLEDLTVIHSASQASSYHPRDIVQTTDTLYSPLYNLTNGGQGQIALGSTTRAFGSYSEATVLHTGNSTVPAHAVMANQATGTNIRNVGGSVAFTVVGEKFTSTATMNGKTLDGMYLSLSKQLVPTGTATVGTFDSSGNVVTTFGTLDVANLSTSQTTYYIPLLTPYTVQTNDRIGIKFTGGDATNYLEVYDILSDAYDGTNSIESLYNAGWSDQSGNDIRFGFSLSHIQSVVYDAATDAIYTAFESGQNTIRIVKRDSSTTLLGTAFTHSTGQPFSLLQLADKIILQTATNVYQITTASDTVSTLLTGAQNTRYSQPFTVSPAAFTFSSTDAYMADSDEAYLFDPATGSQTQTQILIDTTTAPTLGVYDPARYVYLQGNDLTIEASGTSTTWTISDVGTRNNYEITGYSEQVGISLINNSTLFSEGVLKLNCDSGVYQMLFPMFSVGDDSDCTLYRVTVTSAATVGREIYGPFERTADLVHADTFTGYTFEISDSDPTIYRFFADYDNTVVHVADFDSAGQILFPGLYGNCYDITIENMNSGSTILFGNICANDATTKSLSLASITIPPNWQGVTWFHNATRDYSNELNNSIRYDVMKNIQPYNVSIHVIDHPQVAYRTVDDWYNYTGQSAMTTLTLNGFLSNQTIWITSYEGEEPVAQDVLGAQSYNIGNFLDPLGDYFGVPVVATLIVGVAAIWRRENAYFGVVVTIATAGVLFTLGMFEIDPALWAVIMVIGAVGVLLGVKRT